MGDANNTRLLDLRYFPPYKFISCTSHTLYTPTETIVTGCVLGAAFLAALVLNILIYLGFFVRKDLQSLPCGRIIRHVMVPSDLMTTLIIPIQTSMHLCGSFFILPAPVCPVFLLLAYVGGNVSKYSVSIVALERFIAIRWPLKHRAYFTTKVEWCVIVLFWTIVMVLIVVEVIVWPLVIGYYQAMPAGICDSPMFHNGNLAIVHRILAWYTPFTMTLVFYILLFISVRKAIRAMNKAVSNEELRQRRVDNINKTFRVTSLIIFAFAISWMPFQIVEVLNAFKVPLRSGRLNWRGYAIFLTYINVVINPVVYFFMDPKYRDAVLRLIFCRKRGFEASTSVKLRTSAAKVVELKSTQDVDQLSKF